jgi:hypothetical protein
MLDLVLMLWIYWLVEYKSLFFTTNNSTENIYWDCKGRISSRLSSSARMPTPHGRGRIERCQLPLEVMKTYMGACRYVDSNLVSLSPGKNSVIY